MFGRLEKKVHHLDPMDIIFSAYSPDEIRKISVTKVIGNYTFDVLGNPLPGGLYDLAMGPHALRCDPCTTCHKNFILCPGHIGHIELSLPVFNPFFQLTIQSLLKIICFKCFHIQISSRIKRILELQINLIEAGFVTEANEIEIYKSPISTISEEILNEEGILIHPKLIEYENLLKENESEVVYNTKNSEASLKVIRANAMKDAIKNKCINCEHDLKRVTVKYGKLVIGLKKAELEKFYKKNENLSTSMNYSQNKTVLPSECREYFRNAYEMSPIIFNLLFPILKNSSSNQYPTDVFFLEAFPVTPPNVRPTGYAAGTVTISPSTKLYGDVINANTIVNLISLKIKNEPLSNESLEMYNNYRGDTSTDKLFNALEELQRSVDILLDSSKAKNYDLPGLKQIIEKKTGIIRKNMMGKRVNYAARTVITPDPNINVDEIGVPEIFAKKLTYPVPITSWNLKELRKYVLNGPNEYPGANFIEYENGKMVMIPGDSETKRESIAKLLVAADVDGLKIIHRHLLNGDMLVLNRQPTLHRNSIQCHKARILKGEKVFRLHYSNCKAYNADFDGDEMNAHFPQNELARSEAYNLANVANNYTVPKDGTPLGGLIQDHMISGVCMAIRGKFFNKEDYQQLVYQALPKIQGCIKLLPPTILKPFKLWSGKQILSTIIINIIPKNNALINLTSTAKLSVRVWENLPERRWNAGGTILKRNAMSESEVVIKNGELLVGVLDKKHYGSTTYGLVHSMYDLYGGECAINFLTALTKCFTLFLQWEGFSLGVKDILVLDDADEERTEIIKECRLEGDAIVKKLLNLPNAATKDEMNKKLEEAYANDSNFKALLDRAYKSVLDDYTNKINRACIPNGLIEKFPENNLQLMIESGAKGSAVNAMQISCLLGQIELEGKRPPVMISGKSLPSFSEFETSPKSGGFIDGRFLTGIQPQDFFFHCMAGREGLIDTAVKTSRSGYLQRCLIKHLEGLNVNYDMTVRDSDNSVIQFLYGEDGMDISRSKFLNNNQLPFLLENSDAIITPGLLEKMKSDSDLLEKLIKHKKKLRKWFKKTKKYLTGFDYYSKSVKNEVSVKKPYKKDKNTGRFKIDCKIIKLWNNLNEEDKEIYLKKSKRCPDPLLSLHNPGNVFGVVSENIEKMISKFSNNTTLEKDYIRDIVYAKYLRSLSEPGEPVGLLAAQSIGEPSTQMTLNTFHFAGRGEMNVTLGIPRLREILMYASHNIKTPSMDIPFRNLANLNEIAEKLRLKMYRVTLADVLEKIHVKSSLKLNPERVRTFNLKFNFLPSDAYSDKFTMSSKRVIKYMSTKFFQIMFRVIIKAAREKNSIIEIEDKKKSKKKQQYEDEEEERMIDEKEPESQTKKKVKNDDSDSSDDEIANAGEENEALNMIFKNKGNDENDYDDSDSEKAETDSDEELEEDVDQLLENPEDNIKVEEEISKVVESHEFADSYTYDVKRHLWCELNFSLPMKYPNLDLTTILKETASKAVIDEIPLIKRAITYEKDDELMLKTDGINITEMCKFNKILDLNRLYTNDIHAMTKTYGIEAGRQIIVKEIQNVFGAYGITVDVRHLYLIADYMTFDGTVKPLSRVGMQSSASPLQQISFESSLKFLKEATVYGKKDNLDSPSSCLMLGQPCKNGTGSFSLITDYNSFLKYYNFY